MMEVEKILESKTAITSPCFDAQGNLYMCSTQTGDLLFMNINDNAVQVSTSLSEKKMDRIIYLLMKYLLLVVGIRKHKGCS